MDTSFITENKKTTAEYVFLGLVGLYTLWWFPINLIYGYLAFKAFTRDRQNILNSMYCETRDASKLSWEWFNKIKDDLVKKHKNMKDSSSNTQEPAPENSVHSVLEETAKQTMMDKPLPGNSEKLD